MKRVLLIIIIATSFTSCIQVHCPAFPKELKDNYFPYSNGELLTFTNSSNDTFEITIKNNWISDSYSFARNCDCLCASHAGFDTEQENKYSLNIQGSILFNGDDTKIYTLRCEFHDVYTDEFETEKRDSIEDTAIFGDTIFMEKQAAYRISSVKIVKNKGIVEFWDKQQNCNWVKIE